MFMLYGSTAKGIPHKELIDCRVQDIIVENIYQKPIYENDKLYD